MVSIQNLEFELQKLLKEKKYSEIFFEITSKTKEEDRNAGLFVLLGICRISLNKKNKDQIELAKNQIALQMSDAENLGQHGAGLF